MAFALVMTAPPPLPVLEKKLEKAVALTGRSTVPVPMNSENREGVSAAVSVRVNDCCVIVGGMKLGLVIGSSDEKVPDGFFHLHEVDRLCGSRSAEELRDCRWGQRA